MCFIIILYNNHVRNFGMGQVNIFWGNSYFAGDGTCKVCQLLNILRSTLLMTCAMDLMQLPIFKLSLI